MTDAASAPAARRYAAFISYRHADNREPGRRWAEWLHHALETYAVPPDLAGRPDERGRPVPASLYPVFRDEEELSADADLSHTLRRALEASDALIVLCSPRAAASRYVADEVRAFKELGRGERVFALLLDGDPAGVAGPQCLPEPLRTGVARADGSIDWTLPAEPLAADVRPGGRAEQGYTSAAAYGEALKRAGGLSRREVQGRQRELGERLDLARLKLIAGLLGVPLGRLRARDAAYRARRLRRLAVAFGLLALLAVIGAVVAVWQAGLARESFRAAEDARLRQRAQLVEASRHAHAAAERELSAGRWRQAVALLGQALRYDRENAPAAAYLWSLLAHGTGDRDEPPLAAFDAGAPVETLALAPDGAQVAWITSTGRLTVLDTATGRRREAAPPIGDHARRLRFHPGGRMLVFGAGVLKACLVSWKDADDPLEVRVLDGDLHDAAFSRDGLRLATLDVRSGLVVRKLGDVDAAPPSGGAPALLVGGVFSDDGSWALARRHGGGLERLDVERGSVRSLPDLAVDPYLLDARLANDGEHVAAFDPSQARARVLALSSGEVVVEASSEARDDWLAWAPDARSVLRRGADGRVELCAIPPDLAPPRALQHPGRRPRGAFRADGAVLATASDEGEVALWRSAQPPTLATRTLRRAGATGCAWLGPRRAAVLAAERVELWDLDAAEPTDTLAVGAASGGMAVAGDGSWLAVLGAEGLLSVWDPRAGALRGEVRLPAFETAWIARTAAPRALLVYGLDMSDGRLAQSLGLVDVDALRLVGSPVTLDRLAITSDTDVEGTRILVSLGLQGPWQAYDAVTGARRSDPPAEEQAEVLARRARLPDPRVPVTSATRADGAYALVDRVTGLAWTTPLGAGTKALHWSPDGLAALTLDAGGAVRVLTLARPATPGPLLEDLVAAAAGVGLSASGVARPLALVERAAAVGRLRAARADDPDWASAVARLLGSAAR